MVLSLVSQGQHVLGVVRDSEGDGAQGEARLGVPQQQRRRDKGVAGVQRELQRARGVRRHAARHHLREGKRKGRV